MRNRSYEISNHDATFARMDARYIPTFVARAPTELSSKIDATISFHFHGVLVHSHHIRELYIVTNIHAINDMGPMGMVKQLHGILT